MLHTSRQSANTSNVLSVIMGGGQGTRLFPLTKERAKPAVPIAGNYRLVDVPVSNCINSGLKRIYVLTQFNSVSLHRHIQQSYKFDAFTDGFVDILAAQQIAPAANTLSGDQGDSGHQVAHVDQVHPAINQQGPSPPGQIQDEPSQG